MCVPSAVGSGSIKMSPVDDHAWLSSRQWISKDESSGRSIIGGSAVSSGSIKMSPVDDHPWLSSQQWINKDESSGRSSVAQQSAVDQER